MGRVRFLLFRFLRPGADTSPSPTLRDTFRLLQKVSLKAGHLLCIVGIWGNHTPCTEQPVLLQLSAMISDTSLPQRLGLGSQLGLQNQVFASCFARPA